METQTEGDPEVLRWVGDLQQEVDVEANSRRIFRRYYGWVRGFFNRHGVPSEKTEDLAQETFFQAFQGIRSFRGGGTFESWLFAIAANLLRNEKRHLSRQKRAAPEVSIETAYPEDGIEVGDGAESPAEAVLQREQLQALDQAIAKLPEKPRACIRLRLAGYDYPEIAEILKLSPSTVRVNVFTARQRLQEEFGEWIG